MQRILLAYDGSEPGRHAAARAAELARALGSGVTVLVVGEMMDGGYGSAVPVVEPEVYERAVSEAVELLGGAGVKAHGRLVWADVGERPGRRIVRVAAEEGSDLIVLGHRGRSGLASLLVGSVAKHVIDHAECSVLVVR